MLTSKEIMEILPHRSPFLLVDRIIELIPGEYALGRKCVSYNEPFFAGHFPKEPVMPGVLIIEALAQVGAVILLCLDQNKGKTAYFAGIDKARFKNKVIPGDVLSLEVKILKVKGGFGIAHAKAFDEDKIYAEADMTFVIS